MRPLLLLVVIALPCLAAPVDAARLSKLFGFNGQSRRDSGPVDVTKPLPFRLLGTLCGERPLAAIATDTKTLTVTLGDLVLGVEIVSIERALIGVRRSELVELLGVTPRLTRQLVQQQLANPTALMNSVRLVPAFTDGKLRGFKALHVAEGSTVASLGLKAGDVLRAVNGVKLDSPEQLLSLYSQLATTRRFDVELERNGAVTTQTLMLDE